MVEWIVGMFLPIISYFLLYYYVWLCMYVGTMAYIKKKVR